MGPELASRSRVCDPATEHRVPTGLHGDLKLAIQESVELVVAESWWVSDRHML